jgi:UDP:flavonoid glycosyltransferase YjiC (YdhE family)
MARLLVATWDGAGNTVPTLAIVEALVGRGHAVDVIGHDVQKPWFEAAGAAFLPFETTPQWNQGERQADSGEDVITRFMAFDAAAANDVVAATTKLKPAAVLIDCMMPSVLRAVTGGGVPTVALVHAPYGFFAEFAGGLFRQPIDQADLALGLTYRGFDAGAGFPANLVFVGPARPAAAEGDWRRTAPGKPLVVVSLSTGLQGEGQQALLQRACDGLAELDAEGLATTGRGIAPESLRGGANTTIARRVPHDLVLPQADLLITHGGHGTIMAALTFGAPILCLARPIGDQPYNAAKVVELGLGVALDPDSSSDQIRDTVAAVLGDPSFKARSKAFAADVASENRIDLAVEQIEALA